MGQESVSSPSRLKKSLVASAVAAAAIAAVPAANAGIELGEGFSATGFVDQSFLLTDVDGSPSSKEFGIDQVEMDFMYSGANGISAEIDIEYGEDASDLIPADTTFVEQAFVTKAFTDQFSVKLGRFLSYSGWEAEEPTGLFQYSGTGYAKYFYGYYQQGISAAYKGEKFAVTGSLVTDAFGYAGGAIESDTKDMGYEIGLALMPVEGLTAKAFYIKDEKTDREVINFWASYAVGGFTFAGEYNDGDYGLAGKGDGYLLMANYATGPWGVTLRYHAYDIKPVIGTISIDKASAITFSPSFKVSDNLLLVSEFRSDNVKTGPDVKSFALEALFTF